MEVTDFSIVTEKSLALAEGIANYTILVVLSSISLVLFIILVIYYLIDIRERRKQAIEHGKSLAVITDFINKMADTMKENAMRSVNLDMARGLIASELEKTKWFIVFQVANMKQKNHLDDKEAIEVKIQLLIEQTYYKNYEILRKFEFQGKLLSTFLEERWKGQVFEQITKDCTNNHIDLVKLSETYDVLFVKFKNEMNRKLDDTNNNYCCD